MTKPGIVRLVLVTATIGFALGGSGLGRWPLLVIMLIGTALGSAGAFVLNHYFEREPDALMDRTRNRPLPAGTVSPRAALIFGLILLFAGTLILYWGVNLLSAALVFGTSVLYVLVYTPLKRLSWWNTPIGAIPGAVPPLVGWAASNGRLDTGAWVLFLILFLWQHPHFYALAWMYREDYERGGFKMLPVVDPDGKSTFRHSLVAVILLVPVSMWPFFVKMSGPIYLASALVLGVLFLLVCIRWRLSQSIRDARLVFIYSILYWMLLFVFILIDAYVF
ncbi:MAG: heme o synthase [Candidatus Hydrogenedentes bacterium]|nr:heme o synthase [Candidatus Hydrogenedentota bacterium]